MRTGPKDSPAAAGSTAEDALRRELEAQRQAFDRELVRRAFRIGELERQLEETTRTYELSLSWRITRPLREAKAALARRG
jgi:hypothetical protein